jgi:PAS domain S-box-containing protein
LIISTYSSDDQMIRCVYARFQSEKLNVNLFPPLRLKEKGKGGQSDIIHSGEARIVNNFSDYVDQSHVYEIDNSECIESPDTDEMPRSAIYVPVKYNEQVLGVIQLHSNRPNAYTEYHLRFLTALSPQIAAAMTNATLYKQARQRQAIAETLSQSVMVLNSSLALEDVLDHILEYYHRVIPFDSASIQQKEGDHLIIKAARGFRNDAKLIGFNFGLDNDLPNVHVLRTRKPMALVNVRETYPYFAELTDEYQASDIYSWLGVPLIVDDVVIGMITIDRTEKRPFTPEEITLSMTFANHASIAFRNAALYSELETHNEKLELAVTNRTAELQRTTDQIQIITDNSPDAILLLGADRTIEQCNPAFGQIFQYAPQNVLGKRPCDLIATAEEKTFAHMMETAVTNQTTCRLSTIVQTQDGRPLEVDATMVPILENNQIIGIVCSLHDISGYKEIERMKDAFVSNVSHELRTPIANLRLHHDLLSLDPSKRDIYMARLGREIDRLTNIIEDLLRISRLDQKRITVNLVPLDLVQLAEQYLNDRQALAAKKQLTLIMQTETAVPLIQGDPRLLEQVIGIILTNAMNYTPPGGTITITPIHDRRPGQEWAGLRISDTGAGIPDSERDHIFERFYRGYIALESGQPGTGLGLAIAQEIIHIHQGRIELDTTKPGEGAAFTIWLPANAPGTST